MLCYEKKSLEDCILCTINELKLSKVEDSTAIIVIANRQLYDNLSYNKSILSYQNINIIERIQIVHIESFTELIEIIRNCFNGKLASLGVLSLFGVIDEFLNEGSNVDDSEFLSSSLYTSRSLDYACNLLFNLQSYQYCKIFMFGNQDILNNNECFIPIEEKKLSNINDSSVKMIPLSLVIRKWIQDPLSINK